MMPPKAYDHSVRVTPTVAAAVDALIARQGFASRVEALRFATLCGLAITQANLVLAHMRSGILPPSS